MNKYRMSASKPRRVSRWEFGEVKRKSMSLHDLTAEAQIEPSTYHQNSSLMTLDSIPKSRDSGISRSRSASRLSLASTNGVGAVNETPRSSENLILKINTLEAENKRLKQTLRDRDRLIKEHKMSYQVIFENKQSLERKYAQLQNELDRLRCQIHSGKSEPPNIPIERVNSEDEQSERYSFRDPEIWGSSASELSQSDQDESQGGATITSTETTLTPEEQDEESSHFITEVHADQDIMDADSTASGSLPGSSGGSSSKHPELQGIISSSYTQPRPSPVISHVTPFAASIPRQDSPAPSSRWTLDKSFQLVSDSDRSEIGEDLPTFIESIKTDDSTLMTTYKSEETLKADFDELDVIPIDRGVPKSASISTIHESRSFINELPEEDSTSKVQRWCRETRGYNPMVNSLWTPSKRKPQSLNFTNSPLLQRLKSPQNLLLLSPRPFQARASSDYSPTHGHVHVPPLDLSALKSDSDMSSLECETEKQPVLKPKQSGRMFNPMIDQMLMKAQKNLNLSQNIVNYITKSQGNHNK